MKPREIYPSKTMNPLCEQAGCSVELASKHAWKWQRKRWHSHPSLAFISWWDAADVDPTSGAHIGGHPEARRRWARKEEDGSWTRRWYGTPTEDAWNTTIYVEEFESWQSSGSPEKDEPFISVVASVERQKAFWHDFKPLGSMFGQGHNRKEINLLVDKLMKQYPGYDPTPF